MQAEKARLTNEKENQESNLRTCMGEDLSALSLDDLCDLEQQLQSVLSKVRARKVILARCSGMQLHKLM
jgi:ribosomal protein S20